MSFKHLNGRFCVILAVLAVLFSSLQPLAATAPATVTTSSPVTDVVEAIHNSDILWYTVFFENQATASAPAQEVVVVDWLDPDLDWSSFRFREVAFGDTVVPASDGSYQFYTRQVVQDYRPEMRKTWWVDISGEINPLTGAVQATQDPATRQATFTVNTTDDADDGICNATHCSLREAINAANANAGADTIAFNIPGSGVHTIAPASPLPAISDALTIDGTTQPGFAGAPLIELRGINASAGADGLQLRGPSSVVRGLVINRFLGDGIELAGSGGHVVEGCYIGTNASGSSAQGNSTGIYVISHDNRIGGTTPAARNIISANSYGIYVSSASRTVVQGNYIGTDVTGSANLHNTGAGIYLYASTEATVGGTTAGAGNIIAFNGTASGEAGITLAFYFFGLGTRNRIQGNAIFSNAGLGIDLLPAGVTPNDDGDGDIGVNYLQNFPLLSSASGGGSSTRIAGTLNSLTDTDFTVEFFANSACDPSEHGEGEHPLGTETVTTDSSGNVTFTVALSATVPAGQFITATATDPNGNTSEFSQCIEVTAAACYDWQPPAGVGVEDIQAVASRWYGAYDLQYDVAPLPPDGVIDIVDIMRVASHWQETCQ